MERGYPPPHPTRGSEGVSYAPPVGSGASSPRKTLISRLFSASKHYVYATILPNSSRFLNQKSAIAMTRPSTDSVSAIEIV